MKFFSVILVMLVVFQLSAYEKQTILMPMDDGIGLETDIYLPDGYETGSYPVILNRSPYDRTQKEQSGIDMTSNNVVFVAQSVRGTFKSEGTHGIWHTDGWGEHKDGYDTLKWITEQSWCNGKIATLGGSAEGLVQYFMAGLDEKPSLVYQIITVAAGDLYTSTFFPGGILREHAMVLWLEGQNASFFVEEMKKGNMYSKENEYWDVTDIFQKKENLNVPAVHQAGWFDMFAKYQIDTFRLYQEAGATDQNLVIGPWDHNNFTSRTVNELTFPENAEKYYEGEDDPAFGMLIHYFWPTSPKPEWAPVTYYTMGDVNDVDAPGNEWRTADKFPPAEAVSQTLTASDDLILKAGECGEGKYVLNFDLSDPFPSVCGNNLTINSGPCDVSSYRERSDVLSFSTVAFEEATEITGAIDLSAKFKADVLDFDMVVIFTDIYPDGKEYLLLEGAKKVRFRDGFENEKLLEKDEPATMEFNVGYLSIILDKGHKLGIHVASAYSPKYRLPSTVKDYWNDDKVKGEITFDLSETKIIVDTIGNWGGEKCEVNQENPDDMSDEVSTETDEETDDETVDSVTSASSSGCSLLSL